MINYKNDNNKKNKEFQNLKIAFLKLDDENKKNLKIIEEILLEAGRTKRDGEAFKMSPEELENEVKNVLGYSHPSDKMIYRLKEVIRNLSNFILNFLNIKLYYL